MPELPEVECIRRFLSDRIPGRYVTNVQVFRTDVITHVAGERTTSRSPNHHELLLGARVVELARHGKQLAIVGDSGAVVCVRLGMSGQLLLRSAGQSVPPNHVHVLWRLDDGSMLAFRDPRRFGGLLCCPSLMLLIRQVWSSLGPDAAGVSASILRRALIDTRRPIKAAILEQSILAGVGNMYADEALFAARLHPAKDSSTLDSREIARLASAIRRTLAKAVAAGGSTLRDYVQPDGRPGQRQSAHRVYGRSGLPCFACGTPLRSIKITGRTTTFCPDCQRPENR